MVEKKAELAALQAAKSPFAAAEAQAHPGELSTDEVRMASSRSRQNVYLKLIQAQPPSFWTLSAPDRDLRHCHWLL